MSGASFSKFLLETPSKIGTARISLPPRRHVSSRPPEDMAAANMVQLLWITYLLVQWVSLFPLA